MINNDIDLTKEQKQQNIQHWKIIRESQKQENKRNCKGMLHEDIWVIHLKLQKKAITSQKNINF